MAEIFIKVLNMSISASWLILAALVLRLLLKRAPKRLTVLLWAVVGVRAVLPFSIESALSLIPSAETVSPGIVRYAARPTINTGVQFINDAVNPIISEGFAAPTAAASVNPMYVASFIAAVVWLIGLGVILIYALVSYASLLRRVGTAEWEYGNVYRSPLISEPFVLGIFRPRIYLPVSLSERDEEYVLCHERAHIERRDTITRPLGYVILALHWFNPLMWLAWRLFCRDIEYACDERVISGLNRSRRADYSQALLNCSAHSGRRAMSPLAFSEGSVMERIKQVLSYKKPAAWIVAGASLLLIVLAVCFLTDPERGHEPPNLHEVTVADGLDVPEQVLDAAEDYIAAMGEVLGGSGLNACRITDIEMLNTGLEVDDDALAFYKLDYTLSWDDDRLSADDEEPYSEIEHTDSVYTLFLQGSDGWIHIGDTNSERIDTLYASAGAGFSDRYSAAAAVMYSEYNVSNGTSAIEVQLPNDLESDIPDAVVKMAREYVTADAWLIASSADVSGAEILQLTRSESGSGELADGSEYELSTYLLSWRVKLEDPGAYTPREYEKLDGGYVSSTDACWMVFAHTEAGDEYIGTLRNSEMSGTLLESAAALYEAWLGAHGPSGAVEVVSAQDVEFEPEGVPEPVIDAAREYVAREASHYAANIAPPGGGTYEVVSAAVTYASRHDAEAETGDGELVFYEFSYDIDLDPDDEIDAMDSVGVTTAWTSDELRLCMLFLEQDGAYTYIGEYNSSAIDMIYAESGMAERYPDKYIAAAVNMYDLWLEQRGLGVPDEIQGALIYRSSASGVSIPAQTVTDPFTLDRLWSGCENERGGTLGDGAHYIVFFYDEDDTGGSSSRMWNVCPDSSYFDDITRLYEQVQIIERTDEDVVSALAAARAYCEASGTPVTRVWYDRNASSREAAYNFFMDPSRAGDISNYVIVYADSWQNSPLVIELTRESASSPWTARYNGVSTLAGTDMGSDNVIVEG